MAQNIGQQHTEVFGEFSTSKPDTKLRESLYDTGTTTWIWEAETDF